MSFSSIVSLTYCRLSYECVVKRLGTLLYPRNGNLKKCLSLALYRSPTADNTSLEQGFDKELHRQKVATSMLKEVGNVLTL